uniref:Uncharacterized protein n=1 Tax=Trichuris muris TaxID=70415 RepID=A0A5S6R1A7_TRIMR
MIGITTVCRQFLRGRRQSTGKTRISNDDPLRPTIITANAKCQINTRPGNRTRGLKRSQWGDGFFSSTDLVHLVDRAPIFNRPKLICWWSPTPAYDSIDQEKQHLQAEIHFPNFHPDRKLRSTRRSPLSQLDGDGPPPPNKVVFDHGLVKR